MKLVCKMKSTLKKIFREGVLTFWVRSKNLRHNVWIFGQGRFSFLQFLQVKRDTTGIFKKKRRIISSENDIYIKFHEPTQNLQLYQRLCKSIQGLFLGFKFNFKFSIWYSFNCVIKRSFRWGILMFLGFIFFACAESLISDDEPLWEPIEWSLWQSWLLFIFCFSWIAENLITSRYGSFTGRDKRVWIAWYKAFKIFEIWWMLCIAITCVFIVTPFYFEITYTISQPVLYWQWFNRIFFAKFCGYFFCILFLSNTLLVGIRWINWKKIFMLGLLISFMLAYLVYSHFVLVLFGYMTDDLWYRKSIWTHYLGNSVEPLKWSWGPKDRDHFTYHRTPTVIWFKYDLPYAMAIFFIQIFFFISLLLLYFQWLIFLRKIYTTHEVTYTFSVYAVSSIRHFFYMSFGLYALTVFSFLFQFIRYPAELLWYRPCAALSETFFAVLIDYPSFLLSLINISVFAFH